MAEYCVELDSIGMLYISSHMVYFDRLIMDDIDVCR